MADSYVIVKTTEGSRKLASKLAKKIVKSSLGACVQVSKIDSFYSYKGEFCQDREFLLTIKTSKKFYKELTKFINKNHSYKLPQIVAVDITDGLSSYLRWIDKNLVR